MVRDGALLSRVAQPKPARPSRGGRSSRPRPHEKRLAIIPYGGRPPHKTNPCRRKRLPTRAQSIRGFIGSPFKTTR
ncbi:hypothetical protein N7489_004740 [Penicillium chrysogenum]|uniref:Uncharacterized protein n=1 Tax=Penicillium chrysogenum TaxID=5076 RepID=A0ABQ8WG34_PENCH|nr:uncharacterized protein N7489_004740 [Penicillium chrysogenum]KAJ5244644.1 hypothetical protein N7489_004740 [Penicillium chrysogenum]KAJ5264564.1 hypothetical protein N7505_007357 [Penicillium chrysogenum]KAJ5849029.1 hypothetical protein N7534_008347 [Penicillium rubens]